MCIRDSYKIGKFTFDTQKQILATEGKQTKLTTKESEYISNCENRGSITTNLGYAGGIVAAKQGGSEVSFKNCPMPVR